MPRAIRIVVGAPGVVSAFEIIAEACHNANRGLCQAFGDESQLPWAEAPEWQRASIRAGVRRVLAEPEIEPRMLHEAWMADKLSDGWVFGQTKDIIAKTHPCLVSYELLSPEQRAKDLIFRAIVLALSVEVP